MVDNESLEFLGDAVLGFVVADLLFRRVPELRRRAEVEDQGGRWSRRRAGAAGRAARPRRSPAARPRRREDRRPPQAGAARRRLRGADRGDLSRWRHRAGAGVHRCASSRQLIDARARRRGVGQRLQVGAAGTAAGARQAAARVPASPARPVPITASVQVEVRGRRARCSPTANGPSEERSGAGSRAAGAGEARDERVGSGSGPGFRSSEHARHEFESRTFSLSLVRTLHRQSISMIPRPCARHAADAPGSRLAAAGAAARSAALRARRRPRSAASARQCSRTQRRSSGSVKL